MKFIYPAIIHDDADGFWAEFPDLEYTSSTGSTLIESGVTIGHPYFPLYTVRL